MKNIASVTTDLNQSISNYLNPKQQMKNISSVNRTYSLLGLRCCLHPLI